MKINITLLFCFVLNSFAMALDVNLEYKFYEFKPMSLSSLQADLINASTIEASDGLHGIASYVGSFIILTSDVEYESGFCSVKEFKLLLNGEMTLPKLKISSYDSVLQKAFDDKFMGLVSHEKQHEQIWIRHLNNTEQEIKKILLVKDDTQCNIVFNKIDKKLSFMLMNIQRDNVKLDQDIYGSH